MRARSGRPGPVPPTVLPLRVSSSSMPTSFERMHVCRVDVPAARAGEDEDPEAAALRQQVGCSEGGQRRASCYSRTPQAGFRATSCRQACYHPPSSSKLLSGRCLQLPCVQGPSCAGVHADAEVPVLRLRCCVCVGCLCSPSLALPCRQRRLARWACWIVRQR